MKPKHTYTPDDDARIRAACAIPHGTKARTEAIKALAKAIGISNSGLRARGRELEARDTGAARNRQRKSRAKPKDTPKRHAVLPVIERPAWMGEPITMQRLMAGR